MRISYSLSAHRAKPLSLSTMLIYELQYLPLSFTARTFHSVILSIPNGCLRFKMAAKLVYSTWPPCSLFHPLPPFLHLTHTAPPHTPSLQPDAPKTISPYNFSNPPFPFVLLSHSMYDWSATQQPGLPTTHAHTNTVREKYSISILFLFFTVSLSHTHPL